jgi:hypothetical protein
MQKAAATFHESLNEIGWTRELQEGQ